MAEQVEETPIVINEEEEEEEEEKIIQHYSSFHQILLVGDGDFSFSLCLAHSFHSASNIVASSLQSYDEVIKMYKNGKSNIEKLKSLGGTVLHGVDATKVHHHPDLSNRKFDRVVYNFPHAGFHGSEDNTLLIQMHKNLVGSFFGSAKSLRVDGQIHVTHKTTPPYDLWDLVGLASRNSLLCIECADFKIENYPGYNNKRGSGSKCDESFPLGECNTFKFIFHPSRKNVPRTKQRKTYLHEPSQNFQNVPNSVSLPIYSFQQQPSWIHSRNSPTCVDDMNGFPSYAYQNYEKVPNSPIHSFHPASGNDMNGVPSYAYQNYEKVPNSIIRPIHSFHPAYGNDMNVVPSYAYQNYEKVPNSISRPIHSFHPAYGNDMNGVPSHAYQSYERVPNSISLPIHSFHPAYGNDMNGFPSHAGLPARHDPRSEVSRFFKPYFSYIQETFGKVDADVEVSVRRAIHDGALMFRDEARRPPEGYLEILEELQRWSQSRIMRLLQKLQDPDRTRLFEPQGMGYYQDLDRRRLFEPHGLGYYQDLDRSRLFEPQGMGYHL